MFFVVIQLLVDESLSWETNLLQQIEIQIRSVVVSFLMCKPGMQIWPRCQTCCSPWWFLSRPACHPCPLPAAGTHRSLVLSALRCVYVWFHCRQCQSSSHGCWSEDVRPGQGQHQLHEGQLLACLCRGKVSGNGAQKRHASMVEYLRLLSKMSTNTGKNKTLKRKKINRTLVIVPIDADLLL